MNFQMVWGALSSRARIVLVLFGIALNLPFLIPIHRPPMTSFDAEFVALFLSLLGCFFVFLLRAREQPMLLPSISFLPLAVIGLVGLQFATQKNTTESIALSIVMYATAFVLVAIAAKQMSQHDEIEGLQDVSARCLLLGASISAVVGLLQWTSYSSALSWFVAIPMAIDESGVYGNVAQQNHYAAYSVMGLAASLFLYFRRSLSGRSALALAGLLFTSIFLSASRGALLYAALVLVFFYRGDVHIDRAHLLRYRRTLKLAAFLLLILVTCAFLFLPKFPQVERLMHFFSSTGPRFFLWQHAWSMLASNPWMGVGFDGFALELTESVAQGDQLNQWGVDHFAHNLFMQVLACSGLTGFLLLGGVMYRLLRSLYSQISQEKLACSIALILLSYSLFEQPFFYAYFLLPLAYFLGLTRFPSVDLSQLRFARTGLLTLTFLALWAVGKTALQYQSFEAIVSLPKPMQTTPLWRSNLNALAGNPWLRPMVQVYAPEVFVHESAEVEQKLVLNSRLLRFAPLPETMYRQAALLAESGQTDQAKRQLRSAILNYPNYASSYHVRFRDLAQQDPSLYSDLYVFMQQEMELFGLH